MLLAEVHNLTGLRLTKSDTDGIFLHFEIGKKQAGLRLDTLGDCSSVILSWAEEQLDKPVAVQTKPKLSDIDLSPQGIKEAIDDISGKRRNAKRKMGVPERIPKL